MRGGGHVRSCACVVDGPAPGPCPSASVSLQMLQDPRWEACQLVVSKGPRGPELEGAWHLQAPWAGQGASRPAPSCPTVSLVHPGAPARCRARGGVGVGV